MAELVAQWYRLLNTLNLVLNEPVRSLADTVGFAPLTAVLLGFLGALSPCQLTTGLASVALIGRDTRGRAPVVAGLAYVAGKSLTYALLGFAFVALGQAATQSSIPVIQVVRKLLGPLMLVVGLLLLGMLRSRLTIGLGDRVAAYAADRLDATRPRGAFVVGAAFGLAFCPTLFLLFFVLLIPLALASAGGVAFPVLFALGTALPVLAVLAGLTFGLGGASRAPALVGRAQPLLTQLAGLVLVLTGLNDTVVYWFL